MPACVACLLRQNTRKLATSFHGAKLRALPLPPRTVNALDLDRNTSIDGRFVQVFSKNRFRFAANLLPARISSMLVIVGWFFRRIELLGVLESASEYFAGCALKPLQNQVHTLTSHTVVHVYG